MIKIKVKEILKERKMTVTELAERMHISRQALTAIVNGHAKMLRLSTIDSLLDCLDITPNELFNEYSNQTEDSLAAVKLKEIRMIVNEKVGVDHE